MSHRLGPVSIVAVGSAVVVIGCPPESVSPSSQTRRDRRNLDAAFPAVLLALVLPALRDPATRRGVVVGAVAALAVAPFVPAGLAVLAGLVGVLAGIERTHDAPDATDATDATDASAAP